MKINISRTPFLKALGLTSAIFAAAIFTQWAWHHAPWAIVILLFIMAVFFFYMVFDNNK